MARRKAMVDCVTCTKPNCLLFEFSSTDLRKGVNVRHPLFHDLTKETLDLFCNEELINL